MLKMIKYEFRRALGTLLGVFGVLLVLELAFLYGCAADKRDIMAITMSLLIMIIFIGYVLILSIGMKLFSSDLKKKEGYLVFMTPLSSYKIVGAKLLATLLSGSIFVVMTFMFNGLNFSLLANKIPDMPNLFDLFEEIFSAVGVDLKSSLMGVIVMVVMMLIQFYMFLTLSYLSMSLSATFLQNKKGRGILGVVLFIVLYSIAVACAGLVRPSFGDPRALHSIFSVIVKFIPQYLVYGLFAVIGYIGTGYLLDKEISL